MKNAIEWNLRDGYFETLAAGGRSAAMMRRLAVGQLVQFAESFGHLLLQVVVQLADGRQAPPAHRVQRPHLEQLVEAWMRAPAVAKSRFLHQRRHLRPYNVNTESFRGH